MKEKCPFPGMATPSSILERHWLDVHARLVTYAADMLNERLPRSLIASTEERISIDAGDFSGDLMGAAPDVQVIEPGVSDVATTGIEYHAPMKLVVDLDPLKQHFIQIIGADDERLIAVIEFISPTNKIGAGLDHIFAPTRRNWFRNRRTLLWKSIWCGEATGERCSSRTSARRICCRSIAYP